MASNFGFSSISSDSEKIGRLALMFLLDKLSNEQCRVQMMRVRPPSDAANLTASVNVRSELDGLEVSCDLSE
ncbi:MAG: hypothetical protein EOP14_04330 [Pseudomonas sp.]|nr:MAG: hypothetical protein EOP14_04330 [Pseudomonas sp.]